MALAMFQATGTFWPQSWCVRSRKNRQVSGFERVWGMGQSISKTLLLWGLQRSVSIKTGPTSNRVRAGQGWQYLDGSWTWTSYLGPVADPVKALMAVASFSRITRLSRKVKNGSGMFQGVQKQILVVDMASTFSQISIQTGIWGMCQTNESDPRRPHLVTPWF